MSRARTIGLTRTEGTLLATAPNATAADGGGEHSPFTAALLKHLPTPGLDVDHLMTEVRNEVRNATEGTQTSWAMLTLPGAIYLLAPSGAGEATQRR